MNRTERRRADAINRNRLRDHKPHQDWVADKAEQPAIDLSGNSLRLEPCVYHMIIRHEDWCHYWDGDACDCDPLITLHKDTTGKG
jgi:hypothetical protein